MSHLASRPEQSTNAEANQLANLSALGASPAGYAIYKPTSSTYAFFLPAGTVGTNTWGTLTGTLSNQLDLQEALDNRQLSLNGTGFVKSTAGVISYDTNTYLTTASAGASYQPLDSDLTTIAGLTATTNNILQSVGSAWASRTPTQVTATLDNFVGDGGLGGTKGLVPAPAAGEATRFLRGDGAWTALTGGGNALTTDPLSQFASTTSAQLAGVISDETGTGLLVFNTAPTFETSITGNYLTASELLITNASKQVVSAAVATYPSLTELTYLKGVTSAIQTQINSKGTGTVTIVSVTTANGVSGSVATDTTTPAITLTLGAITPTTVNGLTITANGTNTLSITAGKTLTILKTMSFTSADDTGVYTLPTGTKTLVATDVATLSSLTSVGTIGTGVWQGTAVAVAYGGSGATTLTGLLQGNGTSAFTAITNSSTVGQVLRVTGASTYAWGALDLADTDAVTGVLPVANGGTGSSTFSPTVNTPNTDPTSNSYLTYQIMPASSIDDEINNGFSFANIDVGQDTGGGGMLLFSTAGNNDGYIITELPGTGSSYRLRFADIGANPIYIKFRVKLNNAVAATEEIGFGLVAGNSPTDLYAIRTSVNLAIRFVKTDNTGNKLYAVTADGTNNQNTDVTGALTLTDWHTFGLKITSSSIVYYIDGTVVATHTTNLPTSTTQIGIGWGSEDNGSQPQMTIAPTLISLPLT